MKRYMPSVLVLLGALSVAGCPAATLSELDDQFTALYKSKISFQVGADNLFPLPLNVSGDLMELSKDADTEAGKLSDDKRKLRIGFRRVALLSAWQAGDAGQGDVLRLAKAGLDDCAQLKKEKSDAPRDCLFMSTAVPLARKDATLRKMQNIQSGLGETPPAGGFPAPALKTFSDLTDEFMGRLDDLVKIRNANLKKAPVDKAFWPRFEDQMKIVFCNGNLAINWIGWSEGGGQPIMTSKRKELLCTGLATKDQTLDACKALNAGKIVYSVDLDLNNCQAFENRLSALAGG